MAFEHRHRIWVDEAILPRYSAVKRVKVIFEIRTNFKVQERIDCNVVERTIDSEIFALNLPCCPDQRDEHVNFALGTRFRDYWMPDEQIKQLIVDVILFAKQIAGSGRRGRIPVAVDLEVCTVQQAGEGNEAAADRAMRPEFLPPLHIYPVSASANRGHKPLPADYDFSVELFLVYNLASIRVGDVEAVELCSICERKPVVGTRISTLRCGHAFHYHCLVRRLQGDISCPICRHPARDPETRTFHITRYDDTDYVSPDDEFSDDD